MPENEIDYNKVNVDDIVRNALGEKPTALKKSFDNEMISRVNDIIMGKRDAIHKDMFGDQSLKAEPELEDDEVLEAEPTEDEIEQAIEDSDDTDELESDEQPEAEPEAEPEEDLRAEFEATLTADSEEEPEEEKNETS